MAFNTVVLYLSGRSFVVHFVLVLIIRDCDLLFLTFLIPLLFFSFIVLRKKREGQLLWCSPFICRKTFVSSSVSALVSSGHLCAGYALSFDMLPFNVFFSITGFISFVQVVGAIHCYWELTEWKEEVTRTLGFRLARGRLRDSSAISDFLRNMNTNYN